jgi:hypothetical protein
MRSGRAAERWPFPQGKCMEWRPGTTALPGLSAHDAFEIPDNLGLRRFHGQGQKVND